MMLARNVRSSVVDRHLKYQANPNPAVAFAISRLANDRVSPTPFGVLRAVQAPEYAGAVNSQVLAANESKGPGDLSELLRSGATWEVA